MTQNGAAENDLRPQVIAQRNFERHRGRLESMDLAGRFSYICEKNLWGAGESVSGLGATAVETQALRKELPALLRKLNVTSVLDIPCGDFLWMRDVDLTGVSYVGADIVPSIVAANTAKFSAPMRRFLQLDLTAGALPSADLILCRDCLVHLSYANIRRAIANIKRSRAQWLLATNFLRLRSNSDIADGDWRPLNLTRPPFHFPAPEAVIVEGCQEAGGAYDDKALALWRLTDL